MIYVDGEYLIFIIQIGKCAYAMAGVHIKILEQTGEIVFSGRNVCMGYRGLPEDTKATIGEDVYK